MSDQNPKFDYTAIVDGLVMPNGDGNDGPGFVEATPPAVAEPQTPPRLVSEPTLDDIQKKFWAEERKLLQEGSESDRPIFSRLSRRRRWLLGAFSILALTIVLLWGVAAFTGTEQYVLGPLVFYCIVLSGVAAKWADDKETVHWYTSSTATVMVFVVPLLVYYTAQREELRFNHSMIMAVFTLLVMWWAFRRQVTGRSAARALFAGAVLVLSLSIWIQYPWGFSILLILLTTAGGIVKISIRGEDATTKTMDRWRKKGSPTSKPPLILMHFCKYSDAKENAIAWERRYWVKLVKDEWWLALALLTSSVLATWWALASNTTLGWRLAPFVFVLVLGAWFAVRFVVWYGFIRVITPTHVYSVRAYPLRPDAEKMRVDKIISSKATRDDPYSRALGYSGIKMETVVQEDAWLREDFDYFSDHSVTFGLLLELGDDDD